MKKSIQLIAVFVLALFSSINAQLSSVWGNRYSHTSSLNYSHESRKITTDASGNVFVLADVTSDLDPNGVVTGATFHYTVILKYDPSGSLLAEEDILINGHNVVGFDNLGGFGLELDASGNVYVGYLNYDAATNLDVQLAKYSNSLTLIWLANYNPTGIDLGVDIKVTSSGDTYALIKSVAGANNQCHIIKASGASSFSSPFYSFDLNMEVINSIVLNSVPDFFITGYRLDAGGVKSILVARIDDSANLIWKNIYNGGSASRDDYGNNLTIGADGQIYVVGASDRGVPTGNDAMVAKYDASGGKISWISYLDNANSNSDAGKFVLVPDIDFVYVGSSTGNSVMVERLYTSTGTPNNSGPSTPGAVNTTRKIYSPIPVEPYNSLSGATLTDMKISATKKVHLTGTVNATNLSGQQFSASFLVRYVEAPPNTRGYIFKLESELDVEGTNFESYRVTGMVLDYVNENVYWLREFFSTFNSHQEERVVVDGLDVLSQFKVIDNNDQALRVNVYPMPVSDVVTISSDAVINTLEITDVQGKLILSAAINSTYSKIDISDLAKGLYIGKAYLASGEIEVIKLLKD